VPTYNRKRFLLPGVLALGAIGALLAAASAGGGSAAAPTMAAEPSISGTPIEGNTLNGDRGNWNSTTPITYKVVWVRCDETGANCAAISGATTNEYKLVSADLGSTIRFRVTAANADGSKTADSNETGVVVKGNGAPASTKPPVISGMAEVGVNLHTTTGSWVGDKPLTFSYQWRRCDQAGNACSGIGGETNADYTLVKADSGKTVRVKVTATNSKGKSSAISDQTAVVLGPGGGGTTPAPGGKSVDVSDIPKDGRLIVDEVKFSPNPVTSRSQQITVKIRVKDTEGRVVRNALVFIRSTPLVASVPTDAPTGNDGRVTYRIQPEPDFPLKNGYNVQFYVKAYRKGDPTLAGIYGSRLVQVATKAP
jgi:hypothetical protein